MQSKRPWTTRRSAWPRQVNADSDDDDENVDDDESAPPVPDPDPSDDEDEDDWGEGEPVPVPVPVASASADTDAQMLRRVSDELFAVQREMPDQVYLRLSNALKRRRDESSD